MDTLGRKVVVCDNGTGVSPAGRWEGEKPFPRLGFLPARPVRPPRPVRPSGGACANGRRPGMNGPRAALRWPGLAATFLPLRSATFLPPRFVTWRQEAAESSAETAEPGVCCVPPPEEK